jgi:hypothetical protein
MNNIAQLYYLLPNRIRKPIQEAVKSYPLIRWYFADNSYLRQKGWMQSEKEGVPTNSEGDPIPWYTYPAIDFIKSRIKENFRVFEYGSGHSSLWFSDHVKEVVAVEDSKEWADEMADRAPENLKIVYQPNYEQYPQSIIDQGTFDIIVIDGRVRTDCLKPALRQLEETGIIILDDFERWSQEDWEMLKTNDFRTLPFFGQKSQRLTESCTALLYRDMNCMSI